VVRAELERARVDVARLGAIETRIAELEPASQRIAVAQSYPDWIVDAFIADHGAERAEALCVAMNRRAPLYARANRLKNTREELAVELAKENVESKPLALAPDGVELLSHHNAYGLAAFRDGRFELQDAASQLVAELVAPPPRGTVADVCAGAGGKTLALGARLGNRGRILAFDVYDSKLEELRRRARRAGLTNLEARLVDPTQAAEMVAREAGRFDRVLVDAPCSGLGVLRRHPETKWRLDAGARTRLPVEQRAILETYAPMVKQGGRLIYATCTVLTAENDAVVDGFLAAHPEFVPVSAKEILGSARASEIGDGERLRCAPDTHDSDGFFAAVLRRS
jgi:16S rRNA (cytosine967-C5)-methyltransferase